MTNGKTRYYYVDEAGDGTIFNARGHVIIGNEGVSRYFILGLLDVADPAALEKELNNLRAKLLDDPYFKGVPSMQIKAKRRPSAFTQRMIEI